jgi:hypothetical protein
MRLARLAGVTLLAALPLSLCGAAQMPADVTAKAAKPTVTPPLFLSETPVELTFTTNIRQLRRDRDDHRPWHPSVLSYRDSLGKLVQVPVRAKTHGYWRLRNCHFPPIRLNFSGRDTRGTIFERIDKPKLVSYCRDNHEYEQYVLQEFQLYRIYQTLTPVSHRARLFHIRYVDSASAPNDGPHAVRYGFLIEDPEQLAARVGGQLVRVKGASADDMDPDQAAIAYLFEYLIGNTDFSFAGLHNGELIGREDGIHFPVAYDFDFSGAVNTPYATVDPSIRARTVRQRVFRGYCDFAPRYPAAAALFRAKRDAIYGLYRDEVGKLMKPGVVAETLAYFDEFFADIATPRSLESVTGNCIETRGR